MKTRRPFVPAAPQFAALEERLAPSNIFGLGKSFDKFTHSLGFHHHKQDTGNTAIIQRAWQDSAKAAAHHTHAAAKSPIIFK